MKVYHIKRRRSKAVSAAQLVKLQKTLDEILGPLDEKPMTEFQRLKKEYAEKEKKSDV